MIAKELVIVWLPRQDDFRNFCINADTEKVYQKLEEIINTWYYYWLLNSLWKVRKSYRIIELVQPFPEVFRRKWDVSLVLYPEKNRVKVKNEILVQIPAHRRKENINQDICSLNPKIPGFLQGLEELSRCYYILLSSQDTLLLLPPEDNLPRDPWAHKLILFPPKNLGLLSTRFSPLIIYNGDSKLTISVGVEGIEGAVTQPATSNARMIINMLPIFFILKTSFLFSSTFLCEASGLLTTACRSNMIMS